MSKDKLVLLIELVKASPGDSATKTAAFQTLRTDWATLDDREDFAKTFHGLRCIIELLGKDYQIRKVVGELRKVLVELESSRLRWMTEERKETERAVAAAQELRKRESARQFEQALLKGLRGGK